MRKIYLFKYGICFEKDSGGINAHLDDLFGMGISKSIKHHTFLSIKRFWSQLFQGIKFTFTNKDVLNV